MRIYENFCGNCISRAVIYVRSGVFSEILNRCSICIFGGRLSLQIFGINWKSADISPGNWRWRTPIGNKGIPLSTPKINTFTIFLTPYIKTRKGPIGLPEYQSEYPAGPSREWPKIVPICILTSHRCGRPEILYSGRELCIFWGIWSGGVVERFSKSFSEEVISFLQWIIHSMDSV